MTTFVTAGCGFTSGKTILATRHTEIAAVELRKLLRIIEANADLIREKWLEYFGEIRYFC